MKYVDVCSSCGGPRVVTVLSKSVEWACDKCPTKGKYTIPVGIVSRIRGEAVMQLADQRVRQGGSTPNGSTR